MATATRPRHTNPHFREWFPKKAVAHLPFERSSLIENLTPCRREDEFVRASLVELMFDAGGEKAIEHACSSAFSGAELLALITKYPWRSQWRSGDLWQMRHVAVQAQTVKDLTAATT
jgi:hypothetical protein